MSAITDTIAPARQSPVPWLIAAAVVALAAGGIGGSVQLARVLCLCLLPFVLMRLAGFGPKTRFQTEVLAFTTMLMGLGAVSVLWSIDRSSTFQYLSVIAINILPLMMVGLLTPAETAALQRLLPRAWLLAGAAVMPLAFYELLTGNHFALGFEERGGGGVASLLPFASGVHGNYNDFSLFLVLCVLGACFAGEQLALASKRVRWLTYLALAAMSLVVVVNSSRGAILGLIAIFGARFLRRLPVGKLVLLGAAVALVTVLVLGASDNDSLLLMYLQLKFGDFSNDLETDDGRLAIIKAGMNGFLGSYGLGVGAGASSSYLATEPTMLIPNPHNLLLEWALNFGVIGLCLLLWFVVRMWAGSRRNPDPVHRRMVTAVILILPLLGVIQSHLTGYTYFWLTLATISVFAVWPIARRRDAVLQDSGKD